MLEDLQPATPAPCKVTTIINNLDDRDAQILTDAINDTDKWTTHALGRALNAKGIRIARDTIQSHRLKSCNCFKGAN